MASFNLPNVFLFSFLIYVQFVWSITTPTNLPFKLEKSSDYLKYTFQDDLDCIEVNYDDEAVWKPDPTKPQPKSLYFSIRGNRALVYSNDSIDILKLEGIEWKSIFSGKKYPIKLNIESKETNSFYEYKKKGDVHTFTAKDGHVFDSVLKQGGCFLRRESMWSARFSGDFATKVVYDERDSKNRVLIVCQINGLTRTFRKLSDGEWEEIEVKYSGSELTADKVKIKTQC